MVCASCGLYNCACRTGKTKVVVGADTPDDGKLLAEAYLARRGWSGDLLTVKRRQAKIGVLGYKAWELTYRVWRAV